MWYYMKDSADSNDSNSYECGKPIETVVSGKAEGHFMIRIMCKDDIEQAAKIWLDTNLQAHSFISPNYWKDHLKLVKELLLQAQTYLYLDDISQEMQGFIGLDAEYIAGIFVCGGSQSHGIGKRLLDYVKRQHTQLSLHVYQKNIRAIKFYQRENFKIHSELIDADTGEKEYCMTWTQEKNES